MRSTRPLLRVRPFSHFWSPNLIPPGGFPKPKPIPQPEDSPYKDIAILGGGITGLTSAYFCAQEHPKAKITLYEKSNRLGGWINSTKHDVDGGTVIFEHGPRSLRPFPGTLALIKQLGLEDQLLITPKTSPAARNRFVWYDDRLVNIQQGWQGFFREPLLKAALKDIRSTFRKVSWQPPGKDETIAEFLHRRGCDNIANNLMSAMIHGIYAGDIEKLSMASVFPSIFWYEDRYFMPLTALLEKITTYFSSRKIGLYSPLQMMMEDHFVGKALEEPSPAKEALSSSIYTLKGGLETLVKALVQNLNKNPNVELITGSSVKRISPAGNKAEPTVDDKVVLTLDGTTSRQTRTVDRVISTIPSTGLAKLVPPLSGIFNEAPATTVCVVNLWYDQPDILPHQGFGFLMPRTVPINKNPEGALGVVFDSDATPELDTVKGTKLTVMLGGSFWKDWTSEQMPSSEEAIEMAMSVVEAHLGINISPARANIELHKDCIPQYNSTHIARMAKARQAMSEGFWSNIKVAGSWYNGIGVNDCIFSAYVTSKLLASRRFGNEHAIEPYVWSDAPRPGYALVY